MKQKLSKESILIFLNIIWDLIFFQNINYPKNMMSPFAYAKIFSEKAITKIFVISLLFFEFELLQENRLGSNDLAHH